MTFVFSRVSLRLETEIFSEARARAMQPMGYLGEAYKQCLSSDPLLISVKNERGFIAYEAEVERLRKGSAGTEAGYPGISADVKYRPEYGGQLQLIDGQSGQVCWKASCYHATGILLHGGAVWVTGYGEILRIKGSSVTRYSHPWFSDLHSISAASAQRLIVSSSTNDAVFEIDLGQQLISYAWWSHENGYPKAICTGLPRVVDKELDWRNIFIRSREGTVHVSSAEPYGDGDILATLVLANQLVAIDRNSGQAKVLLQVPELKHPHSIYRTDFGFMLCDSHHRRVVFLDRHFSAIRSIDGKIGWIQDARLSLDGRSLYLLGMSRLLRIDLESEAVLDSFDFSLDSRIFNIRPISSTQVAEISSSD